MKLAHMIKSMTGYGKAVAELHGNHLVIEVKSINSKGLDLNIRIPSWFRNRELDIRTMLSSLGRGKVDLFITAEPTEGTSGFTLNKPLALRYYAALKELQDEVQEINPEGLLPLVARMPDLLQTESPEIDPYAWEEIRAKLEVALEQADRCRAREGTILLADISSRVGRILELLDETHPLDGEREEMVRNNLQKALDHYQDSSGAVADPNRFEQELIYYLEKMDFTEEKVRLKKHCEYFLETLNEPESQGKKLGFICQEMGREINTVGSKASHAGIQKLVVQMKDELEKIKEQLLNIL